MKTIVAVLLILSIAGLFSAVLGSVHRDNHVDLKHEYNVFLRKHGKLYEGHQFQHRFEVFKHNYHKVQWLNKLGGAKYGMNKFADLTEEEFRSMYLTRFPTNSTVSIPPVQTSHLEVRDTPTSFDWRDHGAVTAVKNQGQCGSCWAFSTTGNIEGQWFLSGKTLVSLSEQQFVDCDRDEDQGCNGGLPSNAYQYAIKVGGVESEAAYPYTAVDGTCKFSAASIVSKISSWTNVSSDEDQMAAYLVQHGPLSIGMNAEWLQFYFGGISDPLFCDPSKLDHGVLIVGYGVSGTKPFWIIKNSWGADWGEQGYFRIIRGKGKCGINTMVTSALV